jgi:hypothetical protein
MAVALSAGTLALADVQSSASDDLELSATLAHSLDAGKAKTGEEVTATVTQDVKSKGQVVVRRGSKLIGHVTSARPLAKGESAASQLAIQFDHAVLKDGTQLPFDATIRAIAAASSDADLDGGTMAAGGAMTGASAPPMRGGGLLGAGAGIVGGASGSAGGTLGGVAHGTSSLSGVERSAGAVGGVTNTGVLSPGSQGVFGLHEVALSSETSASGNTSVLSSTTRTVHLDGGTQMLLRVSASGSAAASGSVSASGGASASAAETTHAQVR